jgi:hypothetical protein
VYARYFGEDRKSTQSSSYGTTPQSVDVIYLLVIIK